MGAFPAAFAHLSEVWGRSAVEEAGGVGSSPVGGRRHAEMGEGRRRGDPPPGRALEKPFLQQVGLVDVFHGLWLFANRDGEGRQPDRRSAERTAQGGEDAPVDLVEPSLVDLEEPEGLPGHGSGHDAVGPDLGEVADEAQQAVGDAGGAPGPDADLGRTLGLQLHTEDAGGAQHDGFEVGGVVVVEPGDEAGGFEIARRSRGTPRIANRLLRRVRDYAEVKGNGRITEDIAHKALAMLDVDPQGFDLMDRKLLEAVIHRFDGGPVGLDNVAASIGEEPGTIEDVIEPYLIQQGYLQRTPRGRIATLAAYRHLGVAPPSSRSDGQDLFGA